MMKVLQGIENSCFPIPTEQSLVFLVEKTVLPGDVKVSFQGEGLECMSQTCLGGSVLVLQTESSCNAEARSPFCGHPERCIPDTYDSNSCIFTCKCEPVVIGTSSICNMRIVVYFRHDGSVTHSQPPLICKFNVGAFSPPWSPWTPTVAWTPYPWWRHQMETFFALLALCAGNSPVTSEFPTQRPVTRSFDIFFDLRIE